MRICLALILTLLTVTSFRPPYAAKPNHLALIIAIGAYKPETGWGLINSQNDVDIVKAALSKIGFNDFAICADASADKKGILKALQALEIKAKPGDMVVIHVSSHGQQIADNNNDEVDRLDEAVVAYGAPMSNEKFKGGAVAYDGSLHLRDEEFGQAINSIRAKVGKAGHVLVIMDSCHSGTGTRGTAKVRGGAPPLVPNGSNTPATGKDTDEGFGIASETPRAKKSGDDVGKFILISGASANQSNYETTDPTGKEYGSLSYAFSKAVAALPARVTYMALFSKIQSEMAELAPMQTPQIEGDVDFILFNDLYEKQERYYPITEVVSDREIKIGAGRLMGVDVGSIVVVEKAGTSEPDKAGKSLAKGKVTRASTVVATVALDGPLGFNNKVDGWVFVIAQSIPKVKIRVSVDEVADAKVKSELQAAIQKMGMAEVTSSKPDLKIRPAVVSGSAYSFDVVNAAYDSALLDKPLSSMDLEAMITGLTNTIQNFAQGRMFKALDLKDDGFKVEISRLLPVAGGSNVLSDTLGVIGIAGRSNTLHIEEGNYVFLELHNKSKRKAYFNVLDIQPDGKISCLIPKNAGGGNTIPPKEELFLRPGEKKIFASWPIRISRPFGNEIFKVVATGVPFDLATTIANQGIGARSVEELTAIEELLGQSFDKSMSRGDDPPAREMGTNTAEFTFMIVRKKK